MPGTSCEVQSTNINLVSTVISFDEDNQLTRFWELEDISQQRKQTEEVKGREELYRTTTRKMGNT